MPCQEVAGHLYLHADLSSSVVALSKRPILLALQGPD